MRRDRGVRRPRRVRPSVVLLIGTLVLALGGVAQAVCPPDIAFGCEITGIGPLGLLVGNNAGTGLIAFGTDASSVGVEGQNGAGIGVKGISKTGLGVRGESDANAGVFGQSRSNVGMFGTSTSNAGVFGSGFPGVSGFSVSGNGVSGFSTSGRGVFGTSISDNAVRGESAESDAVVGVSQGAGFAGVVGGHAGGGNGIYGESVSGFAGFFDGDVRVVGTLSNSAASFTIDHPLEPTNKTLSHAFVESPDMMNIYNGNTITDAHGDATITLPAYFQALNREFRYQLTVIEQFAQAMVSSEIKENQFTIKTDKPLVKVSWMVTGVRQDAYANAHRTVVENEKPAHERGAYLHPEVYGQPKKVRLYQAQPGGGTQPMHTEAAPHPSAAQP
jgi:hypothetical protein